jgi:hypothetical protein
MSDNESDVIYYNKEQLVVSEGGIFQLKIIQNKNRNSEKVDAYDIFLGGPKRKCFTLTLPSRSSDKRDAYLAWIEAHDDCSMEKFISKGVAQHMIQLGITIARNINPNLQKIFFEDNSNFICSLPNGEKEKVPLNLFHLFFHGSTWYEYYFDAKLVKHQNKYLKLKRGFLNNVPNDFNFTNVFLQKELELLLKKGLTWQEFASKISEKYGNKKCAIVYPWLKRALNIIFDNEPYYDSSAWYIDLEENKKKNKTHEVYFESYVSKPIVSGGRKRRTIKNSKFRSYKRYIFFLIIMK